MFVASYAVQVASSPVGSSLQPGKVVAEFSTLEEADYFRSLARNLRSLRQCELVVVDFPHFDAPHSPNGRRSGIALGCPYGGPDTPKFCVIAAGGHFDGRASRTGATMARFAVRVESAPAQSPLEPGAIVGVFRSSEEAVHFRSIALRVPALQNCGLVVVAFRSRPVKSKGNAA